jgi:hypothetical protein
LATKLASIGCRAVECAVLAKCHARKGITAVVAAAEDVKHFLRPRATPLLETQRASDHSTQFVASTPPRNLFARTDPPVTNRKELSQTQCGVSSGVSAFCDSLLLAAFRCTEFDG